MELFAKPGVSGIIEKNVNEIDCILIQERYKKDAVAENGLLEIPAGKIREYENVFDCLRREIREETGLKLTEIEGEDRAVIISSNGYKVLNYIPFSCSQNIEGYYPIMVQAFICRAEGELLDKSDESVNIRWMPLDELRSLINENPASLYPMHVETIRKYLSYRLSRKND